MTQQELLHHIRAEFAGSRIDYEKCAQDMLTVFNKHVEEVIGKDQNPVLEKLEWDRTSLAEYGAHVNFIRNNLRIEQRKRAELNGKL